MEPFKISLHELITIGAIVVSVTTAYVLLRADVKDVKVDVAELQLSVDKVQVDQQRINYIIGVKEGWEPTRDEIEALHRNFTLRQRGLK